MSLRSSFLFATLVALLAFSVPAAAQWGRISGNAKAGRQKNLDKAHDKLKKADKLMPKKWDRDPTEEIVAIDEAEEIFQEVEKGWSEKWRKSRGYKNAKQLLDEYPSRVARARLEYKIAAARWPISQAHATGKLATDAQLDALDAAVKNFEGKLETGWEKALDYWKKDASNLRAKNPELAAKMKREADRKAREERAKAVKEVTQGLGTILSELTAVEERGLEPIPQDRIEAYVAAMAKVRAIDEEALAYYETRLADFQLFNAWHAEAHADAVAKQLGGINVAKGASKGKALKGSFKTKAGWCYGFYTRWASPGGKLKVSDFSMKFSGGSGAVQQWEAGNRKAEWGRRYGVCTLKKGTVKVAAALEFPGTRNKLQWVVTGWPREAFPASQAVDMGLHTGDICDAGHWQGLWTNPVPGTIVYLGSEPHLVVRHSGAKDSRVELLTIANRKVRTKKNDVEWEPPRARIFESTFSEPRCPGLDRATGKNSIKLAKCNDKVRKKYADLEAKYEDQQRFSKSWRVRVNASKKLEYLGDDEAAEWKRSCGPTVKKINKGAEKAFNTIVDWYMDNAYRDVVNRAKRMQLEAASF